MMTVEKMGRVLLIWEPFYVYPERITEAFREMGYETELFTIINNDITDIQHTHNSVFYRRFHRKTMKENYGMQKTFFEQNRNKAYDLIVFCVSFGLNMEAFQDFLSYQKGKKVMYLWDTIAGCPECEALKDYFDVIISFDFEDCQQYSFGFLPTFYINDYDYLGESKDIDFSIFGALHTDREYVLNRILDMFPSSEYVWRASLITERTPYVRKILKQKRKKPFYVTFSGVSPEIVSRIIKHSKVCIDICRPGQSGLTMRTYEAMAAHTKLVTTNENVRKMDFYSENNICVIDRKNPYVDPGFVTTPFDASVDVLVENYSVNNWTKKLIELI